jgi:hypothetical protein
LINLQGFLIFYYTFLEFINSFLDYFIGKPSNIDFAKEEVSIFMRNLLPSDLMYFGLLFANATDK